MMRWKEKVARFMQGRYGIDAFSKFILVAAVVCMVIAMLFRARIFDVLGWALLVYSYFRLLSRDYAKRSAENQKYLQLVYKLKEGFRSGQRMKISTDREHKVFKCPSCGQKTRVPRGKGKIEIDCPRCHNKFVKRT